MEGPRGRGLEREHRGRGRGRGGRAGSARSTSLVEWECPFAMQFEFVVYITEDSWISLRSYSPAGLREPMGRQLRPVPVARRRHV
jgi:hypothetical protein